MARSTRVALLAAMGAVVAVLPATAYAKSGYMTCHLHRAAGGGGPRTYYTYPFKADSADEI